jgi:hypothetical protein
MAFLFRYFRGLAMVPHPLQSVLTYTASNSSTCNKINRATHPPKAGFGIIFPVLGFAHNINNFFEAAFP